MVLLVPLWTYPQIALCLMMPGLETGQRQYWSVTIDPKSPLVDSGKPLLSSSELSLKNHWERSR